MKKPLASYPWYLDDWLQSETRTSMCLGERGLYRELLDLCWLEGSIPNDPKLLRKMTQSGAKEFSTFFKKVSNRFYEKDGRLFHKKVDEKRNSLVGYHLERSESGRKGGLASSSAKAALKPSPSPSPSSLPSGKLVAAAAAAAASQPNPEAQNKANGAAPQTPEEICRAVLRQMDHEGLLPPRYVKNPYGKQEPNPVTLRIEAKLRSRLDAIREAHYPDRLARKIILDELQGKL